MKHPINDRRAFQIGEKKEFSHIINEKEFNENFNGMFFFDGKEFHKNVCGCTCKYLIDINIPDPKSHKGKKLIEESKMRFRERLRLYMDKEINDRVDIEKIRITKEIEGKYNLIII